MKLQYFSTPGVHAVVDGSFGSTGKGVIAAWMAEKIEQEGGHLDAVYSNAGPNSGHTFYHNGEKHVLKQLPTAAVKWYLMGHKTSAVLTGGAVIDPKILIAEAMKYPMLDIYVNPRAAVILQSSKDAEKHGPVAAVAGTRSGTGVALANKILRQPDAVIGFYRNTYRWPVNIHFEEFQYNSYETAILEVSQGFSLGIHSSFYPKVTSRECTVMQGLADARIPPTAIRNTVMSIRTYPIRVGNVDGYSSGDCYPDQDETTWEALGVEPERTTVTNRIRRVFTFSWIQFEQALSANDPTAVFVNFMNYLPEEQRGRFKEHLMSYLNKGQTVIEGWGPESKDVKW